MRKSRNKSRRLLIAGISTICLTFSVLRGGTARHTDAESKVDSPASTATNSHAAELGPTLPDDVPEIGLAAYTGDIARLHRLVAANADLESSGSDKRTPLLLASAGGQYEAVNLLIASGANVNARDSSGSTALHWATLRGDEKIAIFLISHRAEVDLQDDGGATPLMLAAVAGAKQTVEALLKAGADPNVTDASGMTATEMAKRNHFLDIVSLLTRGTK